MLTVFLGCGKNVETSQTDAQLKEEGKAQLKVVPNSEFARESIEEAIMEEAEPESAEGKPKVTLATLSSYGLARVRELKFGDREISDLKPFMPLKGLKELWLYDNQITDLTPLSGLTNLVWISVSGNQIIDLEPLSGLTNLDKLELGNNNLTGKQLEPLLRLINLADLLLS